VAVGVWYSAGYWRVFHQDGSVMRAGEAFNLHIDSCGQTVTATASNVGFDYMYLGSPLADGNSSAIVFATPNWNPPGHGGVYDTHPIGVYYEPSSQKWTVYHQDETAIPAGASFNVLVRTRGTFAPTAGVGGVSSSAFSDYGSGPNCFGSYNDFGPWQVCPNGSHIASATCETTPGSNGSCNVIDESGNVAGLQVNASNNCFQGAQAQLVVRCASN
jgi:hypothetical protein